MKHKKVLIISLIAVGVIAISVIGIRHAISSEVQAKIAAEKGFPDAIHEFKQDYNNYHFNSEQDVTKAYLGEPIGEYRLNVANYYFSRPVDQQLNGPSGYLFPVMVKGEARNQIAVALTRNHKWESVDFGGNMCSTVKAIEKKYEITDVKLVYLLMRNFIIGNDKNNKLKIIVETAGNGYKEYSNEDFNEMIKCYKKVIQKMKEEYKKTGQIEFGGAVNLSNPPTQESAINRLVKYFKSIF